MYINEYFKQDVWPWKPNFPSPQDKIIMDPLAYNEVRTRPSLEERLESIISGAALMADSSCTRDDRRERIVQECNAVRQALQDLLTEYMSNVSYKLRIIFLISKLLIIDKYISTVIVLPNLSCKDIVLWHFVMLYKVEACNFLLDNLQGDLTVVGPTPPFIFLHTRRFRQTVFCLETKI